MAPFCRKRWLKGMEGRCSCGSFQQQKMAKLTNKHMNPIYESINIMSRIKTYILTSSCQIANHIMRLSFPFVQSNIIRFFSTNAAVLGLASAIQNVMIGLIYLLRIIYPLKRLVHSYFIQSLLVSLSLAMIAITVALDVKEVFFLILFYGMFGIFQGGIYVVLLTLVSRRFTTAQDGCILGLWAASGDTGNVIGLFICTCIVYYFKWNWVWCLIVTSFINVICTTLLKLFLENNEIEPEVEGWKDRVKQYFQHPDQVLQFLIYLSMGATNYGILLWLPMYLADNKFQAFQGYIPISYSLFTVMGASFTGNVFQRTSNRKYHFCIMLIELMVSFVCLGLIYGVKLQQQQKWTLLLLIGLTGFAVGGIFEIYGNHQIIFHSEETNQDLLTGINLNHGSMHVWLGLTQIIVGSLTAIKEQLMFLIFLVFILLSFILILIRLWLGGNQQLPDNDSQQ